MGIEPPFLYENPAKHSFTGPTDRAFNPRASSQAAWAQAPRPRPRQDGPLINAKEFNRHPDSYFVVPYGNLNWKPMSPRTKVKVKYARWIQLLFRLLALIDAVGILFCVICIKETQGTEGWIIRIPPGVAILHTIYAIYHLARSPICRTPASSASYMIFAAVVDAGLIPFLVLTALISRTQYISPGDTKGHWQTLFNSENATSKILLSTFLVSVVAGSLHLISLFISLYLAVIFRQISNLPPDMNPLEDNLTSRHKRNKSSLLDNRTSGTTATTTNRNSKAEDSLISPPRTVPFLHTRADSLTNLANIPHPQTSPRASRHDLPSPYYDHPSSKRASQSNINISAPIPPTRPASSLYPDASRSASTRPQSTNSRPRSTAPPLPSDDENWTTHPSPPPSPPFELKHLRKAPYQVLPQSIPFDTVKRLTPRPLEMNPPTPPNAHAPRHADQDFRALAPGTGNTMGLGASAKKQRDGYEGLGGGRVKWGVGRVVSRTGVEIGIMEMGKVVRAREVSGKMVEEGRGGAEWKEDRNEVGPWRDDDSWRGRGAGMF